MSHSPSHSESLGKQVLFASYQAVTAVSLLVSVTLLFKPWRWCWRKGPAWLPGLGSLLLTPQDLTPAGALQNHAAPHKPQDLPSGTHQPFPSNSGHCAHQGQTEKQKPVQSPLAKWRGLEPVTIHHEVCIQDSTHCLLPSC